MIGRNGLQHIFNIFMIHDPFELIAHTEYRNIPNFRNDHFGGNVPTNTNSKALFWAKSCKVHVMEFAPSCSFCCRTLVEVAMEGLGRHAHCQGLAAPSSSAKGTA
jgi:hypothetical protein